MGKKVDAAKERGRVYNSTRNLIFGVLSQLIVLILNFIVRTVFIHTLGIVYNGVNGLFTNILTVLSLMEMGFGTAMIYNMYKPLAERDFHKLQVLMKFYGQVYRAIGLLVAALGLAVIPFMGYIIKDRPDIGGLNYIYILFLANTVSSYFFAYKRSILNADQKAYIGSQYHYYFAIIKTVVQIISLVVFKNFFVYLIIQILATFGENVAVTRKANKLYPFLKEKTRHVLPREDLSKIKKDVKALILSRISVVIFNGTDNIVISAFVGIIAVGMLSNYTLITGSVTMVVSQFSVAFTGSLGNFIASQNQTDYLPMFKRIDFMFFWIYGFCFVCLSVLLNPFITIWLGSDYLLPQACVIVIAANFMIDGFLQSLWAFRSTFGLFVQGKYRPLFSAGLNIVMSIILAKFWGVTGVLAGTLIARLLVNCWYDPYIIFKHGLKHSPKSYYVRYLARIAIIAAVYAVISLFGLFVWDNKFGFISFAELMVITFILPNAVFWLIYRKTPEFAYFKNIVYSKIPVLRKLRT